MHPNVFQENLSGWVTDWTSNQDSPGENKIVYYYWFIFVRSFSWCIETDLSCLIATRYNNTHTTAHISYTKYDLAIPTFTLSRPVNPYPVSHQTWAQDACPTQLMSQTYAVIRKNTSGPEALVYSTHKGERSQEHED